MVGLKEKKYDLRAAKNTQNIESMPAENHPEQPETLWS